MIYSEQISAAVGMGLVVSIMLILVAIVFFIKTSIDGIRGELAEMCTRKKDIERTRGVERK